jgi:hypothetical protein
LESAEDGVNVINNSNQRKTLKIYATDSVDSSGGAFACAQEVDAKTDVGSWITLEKGQVVLGSTENEIVDFSISVPSGADVGEHNGCIVVQAADQNPAAEQGIGLSFRTAIRVAVLVPGEITKSLSIIGFNSSLSPGKVVLTPRIENLGNVSVDADITTTLSYPWGTQASSVGGRYPVLRGQVGEWNFDHKPPFWGGWYRAEISSSYDENPANFIGDDNPTLKHLNYPSHLLFVKPHPLALALEIAVLALLAVGVYMLRRRLGHVKAVKSWVSYKIRPGDDIKSIAKAHGVSWKKLARTNRLKPPYSLGDRTALKVPRRDH